MNQNPVRKIAEALNLPNWAAGGMVLVMILLVIAVVIALSTGATASERVQMIYQLALVIAGLIGLPLAIWRSWTAHRQAETASQQLQGLQRQISLAERGAEADRLQKGAELLQAGGMAVRIAGIAILREIARDRKHNYQKEATQVLASFLRSRSEEDRHNQSKSSSGPEDIHVTFDALWREHMLGTSVDLGSIFIRGPLVLSGSEFEGNGFLEAEFKNVSFYYCTIPSLAGSKFTGCRFDSCEIQFGAINLADYEKCELNRCKLSGGIERQRFDAMGFELNDCDTSQLNISV